jgi:hypothetical protein
MHHSHTPIFHKVLLLLAVFLTVYFRIRPPSCAYLFNTVLNYLTHIFCTYHISFNARDEYKIC